MIQHKKNLSWDELTTEQKIERMRFDNKHPIVGKILIVYAGMLLSFGVLLVAPFALTEELAVNAAKELLSFAKIFFLGGVLFFFVSAYFRFVAWRRLRKKEFEARKR